jgi:23S rRNA pseudouridine2605 synthase
MNDDNDKKPFRGRGPKPAGARGGFKANKGGKPAGGKKPFAKRAGAADGERPQRDFKGAGKPWPKKARDEAGGQRPHGKESRHADKPYEKREARPFEKREGARKPFAPRGERPADAGGERPKRDFRRDDRPRDAGAEEGGFRGGKKPFVKKPFDKKPQDRPARPGRFGRSETYGDADAAVRAERSEKPFRDGPRPQRGPFDKSAGGGRETGEKGRFDRPKRDFGDRPKRDFEDRRMGGFKPRQRPAEAAPEAEGERIAKRLARAGIASRRDAEELIAAGRVKVNGKVLASPAFNVSHGDIIHLDGMEIPPAERTRLFLFHKPAGVVTTNRDPEGRKTVFDVLPAELPRLMTVGRLDINTEGLLLLTNDGGLSRVLELPATGWLRRYRVRVHGKVEEKALADLADGIAVDGVFYGAVEASLERTQGSNAWLTIGLREGKNREVKNILGALGLEVTRLIRVSYGPFQLGELPEGHVLEIKGRTLRDQLGERLIEESGANFEADIAKPFSNKPVRRTEPRNEEPAHPKFQRDGDRRPIGEGGLIKARKRRENSRDEALGKLSTKPERFGSKPAFGDKRGKKAEREQRPIEPPGQRRANVWMAPGARPEGNKAEPADSPSPRSRGEGEGQRPRYRDKASSGGGSDKSSRRPSSALRAPSPRARGEGKPPKKR